MPDTKLTTGDMKQVATNLRKMASDPILKRHFSSRVRKAMNDLANDILVSLRGDLDRGADRDYSSEELDALDKSMAIE
jgi:hypothetical protein